MRKAIRKRVDDGVSISSLARRCEISQGHFSNWLNGKRGFSTRMLDQVCVCLRLNPDELRDA